MLNRTEGVSPLPLTPLLANEVTPPAEPDSVDIASIDITRYILEPQLVPGAEAAMGGFADVFMGTHTLEGTVALKRPRINSNDQAGKDSRRRLEREAVMWSGINHQSILRFLGIFYKNMQIYIVSPWVQAGHISQALAENPLIDRFRLITEIADGLHYLHQMGFVHGDIKAQNILYSDEGHALICDFGLSKLFESMHTSAPMRGAGSTQWKAPELWEEESRTTQTDVYSFGITISEILSGNPPFDGLAQGRLYRHVCLDRQRPPRDPTESTQGRSYAPLWEIAAKCWQHDPNGRPAIAEVYDELVLLGRQEAARG